MQTSIVFTVAAVIMLTHGCHVPPKGVAPELSGQQEALLQHVEQLLIARCMSSHGFHYEAGHQVVVESEPEPAFPYGIDDVSWAMENGFGGPPDQAATRQSPANQRYFDSLPIHRKEAYLEALYGTEEATVSVRLSTGYTVQASTRGCRAEAETELYGNFSRWYEASVVTANITAEAHQKVLASSLYHRALHAWSDCMNRLGEQISSPQELREQFVQQSPSRNAVASGDSQRQLAVAEARCVDESELARTGRALERRYVQQLRTTHREQVAAFNSMRIFALDQADELQKTISDTKGP